MKKVDFGTPYKFKPQEGPAPGQYNPDSAVKLTKPKEYEAFIDPGQYKKEGELFYGTRSNAEVANDPGKYDGHLTNFGSELKNTAKMGNKYKF